VVRNKTDDPLAISGRQPLAGIGKALGQSIDPQATIGVEHDFDNGRIFEPSRDRGPKRGSQHASAA